MSSILNKFKGTKKETLMFLAYFCNGITDRDITAYARNRKREFSAVQKDVYDLCFSRVADGYYSYTRGEEFRLKPEYFFGIAVDMIKNEKAAMAFLRTNYSRKRQTEEFLWALAEILAGTRPASSVSGKFPEGTGPDYLLAINDNGIFDDYLLKFSPEDFVTYMNMRLNKLINNDAREGDEFWARMENLVNSFSSKPQIDKTPLINRIYLDRFLYTGQLKELPKGIAPDYQYLAAQAIMEMYAGHYENSSEMFLKALKERNKMSKEKNIFTHPILSFFLILSYIKTNSDKTRQKTEQFCNKKAITESVLHYPALFAARHLGQPMDTSKYTWEFDYLTQKDRFQVARELGAILRGYYGVGAPANILPNCAIIRHELSPYIALPTAEKQRLEALFGGSPIVDGIRKKEEWEAVLDNLGATLDKAGNKGAAEEGRTERIGYFLSADKSELEVRVQQMLRNGTWGAGKKVSIGEFLSAKLPMMDEIDRKVAQNAVRSIWSGSIRSREAVVHLVGTDRVYSGTSAPYYNVEVMEEKPYLSIDKTSEGIKVGSNFSKVDHSLRNMTTLLWDKKRKSLRVIRITPVQFKILESLFALPMLPLNAEGRLKELLNSVSAHIEVHSDLIEGGSSLETVEGDSTIHLRITPDQEAYGLQIYTLPLRNGHLNFFPGNGERTIYDEADGQRFQVKRKLSEEKKLLENLSDFVSDNLGLGEVPEVLNLDAENMLKLTEWIQEHPEGYAMEWPENKKIKIAPVSRSAISVHSVTGEKWFEAEGEISYGTDGSISLEKLLALISSGNINGNYVQLDDETFLSLTDMLKKQLKRLGNISQAGKNGLRISQFNVGPLADIVHSGQMDVASDNSLEELESRIREASRLEIPVPEELNATLRDYQVDGFRWISRLDHWGAGACLADDMGLGKTLQAIAFMLRKASAGPSLVLAPASVVMNWKKEFAKFAPGMEVSVLNEETDRQDVVESAGPRSVVIASYGLLAHNEELITSKDWNVACLDEAHTIKNRMTRTSASAMQLKASSRLILTGTPVQNYLGELWNLLQFLNPGLLGTFEQFSRKFISSNNRESLKRMVQPFILRRTKTEVLDELPEKTDIVRTVKLSDPELLSYETMRQKVEEELDGEDKVNVNVLAEITRLRQAACSVALVDKAWKGESSKLKEVRELVEEIVSGGNRVLIFSQFTSFLDMVNRSLDEAGYDYFYLNGTTPIPQRTRMVNAFQKNEKKIFVISLKAGGLGLNLTGANYVIHLDPWWNPAIEQQATDRAYRIGQKQNVTVYHLVSEHTIEEKILRLHESKRKLADDILEGTSTASSITMEELRELCARG